MNQTIVIIATCALVTAATAIHQHRLLRQSRQAHQHDLARIKAQCDAMRKSLSAASDAAEQRNSDFANLQLRKEWLQIQVGALQAQLDEERANARN